MSLKIVLKFTVRERDPMSGVNMKCLPYFSSGIWEKKRCCGRAVFGRILETQAGEIIGVQMKGQSSMAGSHEYPKCVQHLLQLVPQGGCALTGENTVDFKVTKEKALQMGKPRKATKQGE